MPLGRPTVYKEEYCQRIIDFFNVEPFKETIEIVKGKTWEKEQVVYKPIRLPTFHKFAMSIGVDRATLLDWATKKDEEGNLVYPDFSRSYAICKEYLKDILNDNGLMGLYNSPYCQFVAKNLTDMEDKSKVDNHISADDNLSSLIDNIGK